MHHPERALRKAMPTVDKKKHHEEYTIPCFVGILTPRSLP